MSRAFLITFTKREARHGAAKARPEVPLKGLPAETELICLSAESAGAAAALCRDAGEEDLILIAPGPGAAEQGRRLAAELGRDLCPDTEALTETGGTLYAQRSVCSSHRKGLFPARGAVILPEAGSMKAFGSDSLEENADGPWRVIRSELLQLPEDLSRAKIVFLGGRGLGSKKNFERMEALAKRMGASAACTRPVATNGWAGTEKIAGSSGWKLNAGLCIAFGVSGAGPLLRGLEGVGTLIAVNTDPDAPIFGYAACGIKADCAALLSAWEALTEE